ncbi:hypothetical protein DWV63_15170 [Enterococcus durans]|nr:hypothetical protein DWV63_15170 [Enterococcus durans]
MLLENVIDPLIRLADKKKLNIVILKHMHSSGEESELINFFRKEIESRTLSDIDVLVPEIENCYEYSAVIKNSSFVLSMRYHGVVMAIKNGVPFLSLGYENKMQEVCNYSGFENNNIFIKRITDKSIDFEELLEKAPMQYEKNSERLDSLKRIASFALDNIEFSRNGYIKNGK